jgi:hypothetical protein
VVHTLEPKPSLLTIVFSKCIWIPSKTLPRHIIFKNKMRGKKKTARDPYVYRHRQIDLSSRGNSSVSTTKTW